MTPELKPTQEQIDRSKVILSLADLKSSSEYLQALDSLAQIPTKQIGDGVAAISIPTPSKCLTDEEVMGIILFANHCFTRRMGFDGMSVLFSNNGALNLLMMDGEPTTFVGEKNYSDPFGNNIYYLDTAGTRPDMRGHGLGKTIGKYSLTNFIEDSQSSVVFLTRTQNPQMIAAARGITKDFTDLSPFWAKPSESLITSINWTIQSGLIARSRRPDSHFDANESFIHWGVYGETGDGTTWENMIKQLEGELDWSTPTAQSTLAYLEEHGSSLTEALGKGHAFILAGEILK